MVKCRKSTISLLLLAAMVLTINAGVIAQDGEGITADEVNAVASKLYCPVCENIPLDTCGLAACEDWRNEIRIYLESGMTEDQIIADFVFRFGDRVSGTPHDPVLRALSLVTPWILVGLAFIFVVRTFLHWRSNQAELSEVSAHSTTTTTSEDDYRSRLERDVQEV